MLAEAGDFDGALKRYEAALEADPDNADAKRLIAGIQQATRFAERVEAGDAASEAGRLDEARQQYEQALALQPYDRELEQKLAGVRFRSDIEAAEAALEAGRLDEAETRLGAAATLRPDDPAVGAIEGGLRTAREVARLVAEGDAALAEQNFSLANRRYREAADLQPSPTITGKLADVEYGSHLAQGKRLLEEDQLNAARVSFEQARKAKATDEVEALLEQVTTKLEATDNTGAAGG